MRVLGTIISGLYKHASVDTEMIEVSDRVVVAGQRKGTIQFIGETHFASGELHYLYDSLLLMKKS